MKMQRFWVGRALLLAVAVLYAGGYVRAQEAKDTLTLTLDRALEIALSDNPTIKVAEEEIALKKVTHKETWQNLLPQASIDGTWNHTISAAQMNLGGQSFKMGMDNSNTVSGVLNISLPIFAPSYAVRYLGGVRFFGALACHGHHLYHHTDVTGCLVHLSGYHRRRFTEYHLALLSLYCYW